MTPPAVDGLGQSNGFTFELLANGGTDRETLLQMRNQLIEKRIKVRSYILYAPMICHKCRNYR